MHTRMRLGELLLASGLLSADQLEAALQGQRSSGMKLGEYLIKQGICRESDVVDAVCRQTGIERYTPSRFPLNLSLSDRLPADVAQRTNAVPLLIRGDVLVVAMMDPLDIDALDRMKSSRTAKWSRSCASGRSSPSSTPLCTAISTRWTG